MKVKLGRTVVSKASKKRRSGGKKPRLDPIVCSTGEVAQTYDKYLKTNHWRTLRKTIAERDKYTCQSCKKVFKSKFHIHHLTYKRIGSELPEDLVFYCEECHNAVHGSKKTTPNVSRKSREEELRKIISRLDGSQIEELIQYATNKYPQIKNSIKSTPATKVRSRKNVVERTAIQIMNNVKLPVLT